MKTAELKELAKCQGWELPKDVNEQDTVYVFTESDLDALLKEEAEELIKHLKGMHPYPEDIFIPPTKEQFEQIHKVLKDAGLSSDAFAGHACRIGYNACIFNIEQLNK